SPPSSRGWSRFPCGCRCPSPGARARSTRISPTPPGATSRSPTSPLPPPAPSGVRRRSALRCRVSGPVFVLLLAVAWGTGVAGEERPVPWELRVSALGQPAARAGGARDDRERDLHLLARTAVRARAAHRAE